MMNEILYMVLVFIAGLILGTLFFGGLWFTVKKAVDSKAPTIWFFVSSLLRIGITLTGFYFIADGNFKRLLICLFGFVIARFIITRITKPKQELKKEVNNEA